MSGLIKLYAVGLVASLAFTSVSLGAQVTETFGTNSDGRWDSLNNRTPPQDYGWSNTDNTGTAVRPPGPDGIPGNADDGVATGAGELGGVIHRPQIPDFPSTDEPTPTFYGFNVGAITPATEGFNISGVMRSDRRDGAVFLGYFTGADSFPNRGKDVKNFIGVLINDGGAEMYTQIYNRNRSREGAQFAPIPTDGTTLPFALAYDAPPAGTTGNGTLRASFGTNSATFNIPNTIVQDIDDLTHFGFFPQVRDAGPDASFSELYFDDLTFTSDNPIPEPASLGLLSLGAVMALRRRVRRA